MRRAKNGWSGAAGAPCTTAIVCMAAAVTWIVSVSGALTLLVALAVGFLGLAGTLAGRAQPHLHAWRQRRRQLARQRLREDRLEAAGARRDVCAVLGALVHEIGAADEDTLERYRVSDLLDLVVELEVTRHRCLGATEWSRRETLVEQLAELSRSPGHEVLTDVIARRLRYWDECADAVQRCDDEIATIRELVEALRLRVAVPEPTTYSDLTVAVAGQLDLEDAAIAETRELTPNALLRLTAGHA